MPKEIKSIGGGHHGASINVGALRCTSKQALVATVDITISFGTGFFQRTNKLVHMMKSGNVRWDVLKGPRRIMCPGDIIVSSIEKRK